MATASTIEYRARGESGREWRFVVDPDRGVRRGALPVWTEISHHRCDGCPLSGDVTHCPAAADLAPIADALGDVTSLERVDVVVTYAGREVHRATDSQELARSLLGLVLATSACPLLRTMRPLAHMHQPFASFEETLFRAVGLHLVRAWIEHQDGRPADFALEDLRAHYQSITGVNRALAKRLRAVAEKDAGINGLMQLFSVGLLVSDELDHQLEVLRELVSR